MNNWSGARLMQSNSGPLWAYDQNIDDFRIFRTMQEWEDQLTVTGAISRFTTNRGLDI